MKEHRIVRVWPDTLRSCWEEIHSLPVGVCAHVILHQWSIFTHTNMEACLKLLPNKSYNKYSLLFLSLFVLISVVLIGISTGKFWNKKIKFWFFFKFYFVSFLYLVTDKTKFHTHFDVIDYFCKTWKSLTFFLKKWWMTEPLYMCNKFSRNVASIILLHRSKSVLSHWLAILGPVYMEAGLAR
jgi:hypothetical protein